jgi:hypothetical protein
MSNILEDITGGKGTVCLGPGETLDNAKIAAIYVREDCPNLVITRERFANETTDTNVTTAHFKSTSPKAGDLIRGFSYNFKKVVVGASGSITVILDK